MRTLSTVPLVVVSLVLAACANSPLMVTRMEPHELARVAEYDLCRAYFSTSPLAGSKYEVENEIRRRGVDCSRYAEAYALDQAHRQKMMEVGAELMTQPAAQGTNCTSVPNVHGGYDVHCY